MQKRLLIIVIGLLVIVLIVVGFISLKSKNNNKQSQSTKSFSVDQKDLSSSELPSGLPKNLPVEAGSSVVQNYETTTTDGRKQSTRISTTSKPLDQAVKIYSDFFLAEGWTAIQTPNSDAKTVSSLFRRKNDILLITASTDHATNKSKVEITLTEATK